MKEMPRLIISLTIIAVLSGLVLAFTFNVTNDKIIANAELKKQQAISEVLPNVDSYEIKTKGDLTYYQTYDANKISGGIAVEASGGGFQGEIKMMIGFITAEEKVSAIMVLNHLETPGLGARITEAGFTANYNNKPYGDYQVVKRPVANEMEVEAIAGATVSSDAVTDIVEKTLKQVKAAFGGEL